MSYVTLRKQTWSEWIEDWTLIGVGAFISGFIYTAIGAAFWELVTRGG